MHRVGIESDQLVYDYLSRVGDLAQRQQLSSGARMRLVSTLRGEIDRRRATEGADSPAAVRRIIGRLGSPDELVSAAAESGDGTVSLPSARPGEGEGERRRSVPRPRSGLLRKEPGAGSGKEPAKGRGEREGAGEPREPRRPKAGFGWGASRRDPGSDAAKRSAPEGDAAKGGAAKGTGSGGPAKGRVRGAGAGAEAGRTGAGPAPEPRTPDDTHDGHDAPAPDWPDPSAPHMLGLDQQGARGAGEDDWWRLEPGPFDGGTAIPGFFGGIEAPELLGRRPRPDAPGKPAKGAKDDESEEAEEAEEAEESGESGESGEETDAAPRRRAPRIPRPRRRPAVVAEPVAAAPAPRGGFAHPLLLLAAVLLIAGVVTGSWIPLAGGWLIAYASRTLSRTEAKWAVLGLPGTVAAGALVWVWGRVDGRWGEPVAEGALRDVLVGAWPVVVRVAAVASALYLVWRARRRA
ncbi:hypothetical protein [Streptomyces sp. cmx-18-6]|uniref:hypothetical protein n=1 Tax=Streptomyces sp. cmx-18-6 TaxID=2790930 RepID=UPI0039802C61